jgi:hypothetical protein
MQPFACPCGYSGYIDVMSQTIQIAALPALSQGTLVFASEQGVTPYLVAVLKMSRRIFQDRPMTVFVDEDPEIANDRHIVIDVDVTGFDAEQMFNCQQHWISDIFRYCPATHVCVFRLAMMDSP